MFFTYQRLGRVSLCVASVLWLTIPKVSAEVKVFAHSLPLQSGPSTFYQYSSSSNSWAGLGSLGTNIRRTQFATDIMGNVFTYNDSTRRINRYVGGTTWQDIGLPSLGIAGAGYNLEVTNSGQFLLSRYGSRTVHSLKQGQNWQAFSIGAAANLTGDYDPVTGRYVVGLSNQKRFVDINTDTFSSTFSSSAGGSGEYRRMGSIVGGYLVENTSSQGIRRWDVNNFTGSSTTLSQTGGDWLASGVDRVNQTLYTYDLHGGQFGTKDVVSGQFTPLASGPNLALSSIAVVNTDVTLDGIVTQSRYDHSVDSLTIGGNRGAGRLVVMNSSELTSGDITVDSNGTLSIESGSTVSLNAGSTTTVSGVLQTSGNIQGAGAQIIANSSGIVRYTDAAIIGGTLSGAGTHQVSFGDASFTDVSFSGSALNVDTGRTATLMGTNTASNGWIHAGGGTTIINSGATLQGEGLVTISNITNNGTIAATSGTLTLQRINSTTNYINNGTLKADGGTLELIQNSFNNTNGQIVATSGNTVRYEHATITGGTLSGEGTHQVVSTGSSVIAGFDGVTLDGSHLQVNANTTLSGTTQINGATGQMTIGNDSNVLLNGTIQGTGSITNNGGSTLSGAGTTSTTGLTNNGTLIAYTGTLIVDAGSNSYTNNGIMRGDTGQTLRIQNGTITGTGSINARGTVEYSGTTISGGTLTGAGTHSVTASSTFNAVAINSNFTPSTGVTVGGTSIAVASSSGTTGQVTINGAGTAMNLSGSLHVGGTASGLGGIGTVDVTGGGALSVADTLNIFAGSTINVDASSSLSAGHIIANGQLNWTSGSLNIGAGQTLSGSGDLAGVTMVSIGGGGIIAPGNSTGTLSGGAVTWGDGGIFDFEINNFNGTAGSDTLGWDLLSANSIDITATSLDPFKINLLSLTDAQVSGMAQNLDDLMNYPLMFATTTGGISGFSPGLFKIDTSGFQNAFTGSWTISQTGNDLFLNYSAAAVPEPSSFLLLAAAAVGGGFYRRRRRKNVRKQAADFD